MIRKLVWFFTIFIGGIFAEQIDFDFEGDFHHSDGPLFVSLGSHCIVALILRDCGLRRSAFPFDWLEIRDNSSVTALFNEDFQFFSDKNYLIPLDCPNPHSVINTYYQIRFHHEWPFSDEWCDEERYRVQIECLQKKYHRRIERFKKLRYYPGKVFFIRAFCWEFGGPIQRNVEEAMEMKKALDFYFPDLDFTLVVINYIQEYTPFLPEIEGVVEYKMNRYNDRMEYSAIYRTLLKNNFSSGHAKDLLD